MPKKDTARKPAELGPVKSDPKKESELSETLSKLNRAVEAQKRQLEEKKQPPPISGLRDLPAGIADIIFGGGAKDKPAAAAAGGTSALAAANLDRDPRKRGTGNGSGGTTPSSTPVEKSSALSAMTEADLLAKAAMQFGADELRPVGADMVAAPPIVGNLAIPPPSAIPPPTFPAFLQPPPDLRAPPGFPPGPAWQPDVPHSSGGSWSGKPTDHRGGHPPDRGDWHGQGRNWGRGGGEQRRYNDDGRRWNERRDDHHRRDNDDFRDRKRKGDRGDGRNWNSGYRD